MPKLLVWSEPRGASPCIQRRRQLYHPHPASKGFRLVPRSGTRFFAGSCVGMLLYSCLILAAPIVRLDCSPFERLPIPREQPQEEKSARQNHSDADWKLL